MVPAKTKARNLVRPKDDELLSAYSDFLDRLPLVPLVRLHRYHGAKRLLKSLKGLALDDPAVAEFLHEADTKASCFIPFLLLHGHLRPGYPYLFSRKLATLVRESALSPLADDVAAVRTTAVQLGFGKRHIESFLPLVVLRIMVQTGKWLRDLTVGDLEEFRAAAADWGLETGRKTRHWTISLHAVQNVLYHMGVLDQPATNRLTRTRTWAQRLADVPQPEMRASMLRYVELMAANRRPQTVTGYCVSFVVRPAPPGAHRALAHLERYAPTTFCRRNIQAH